jgi:hypothetical protein
MLQIEVHTSDVRSFNWSDKKGQQRTGYKQIAWVRLPGAPYPKEIQIRVDDPSKAFAPGAYTLDPSSYWIDRYGSLQVSPVLIPDPAAAKARQAS